MFSLPTDEELARLLGLRKWGLGEHPGTPNGAPTLFEIHALWRAVVEPSFHAPWVLAGILAETCADPENESDVEEDGSEVVALETITLVEPSNSGPLWHKGVLARENDAVAFALECDPVAEALNRIELLRAQRLSMLDGIDYRLRLDTRSLQGEFSFSTPWASSLRALEAALIRIAVVAAGVPGGDWAKDVVELWQCYARERHSERSAAPDRPRD